MTPQNIATLDVLVEIAEQHGVSPGAVAIAWVAGRPGVIGALASARSTIQLESLLSAMDVTLSADETGRLTAASDPAPDESPRDGDRGVERDFSA